MTAQANLRTDAPANFDDVADYIANNIFDKPTLVVSRDRIGAQYDALRDGLGRAHIHYAVKANPEAKLSIDEISEASKAFSLDAHNTLLYNLSEKGFFA